MTDKQKLLLIGLLISFIIVFAILTFLKLGNKNVLDFDNNPISKTEYEKLLGVETIKLDGKIEKDDSIIINNGKILEIGDNILSIEYISGKKYNGYLDEKLNNLIKSKNIKIGDNVIIFYNKDKNPLFIEKYDGKFYSEKLTIEQLSDLLKKSYFDKVELNGYNRKILEISKIKTILENLIKRNVFSEFTFFIEDNNSSKLEPVVITNNDKGKIFTHYYKLDNGKIFIDFIKINNFYGIDDENLYKTYSTEKVGLQNKELLEKLYLKYQLLSPNLFY